MSWFTTVIFSSCVKYTYLEAPYLPSSIWWWQQAYCSWQCRSSLSRCPHSGPHPVPRWWGYLEELRQDTQTKKDSLNTGKRYHSNSCHLQYVYMPRKHILYGYDKWMHWNHILFYCLCAFMYILPITLCMCTVHACERVAVVLSTVMSA